LEAVLIVRENEDKTLGMVDIPERHDMTVGYLKA
jgi:hypothetical protein